MHAIFRITSFNNPANKIEAIKGIRRAFGLGLREAKEYADQLMESRPGGGSFVITGPVDIPFDGEVSAIEACRDELTSSGFTFNMADGSDVSGASLEMMSMRDTLKRFIALEIDDDSNPEVLQASVVLLNTIRKALKRV